MNTYKNLQTEIRKNILIVTIHKPNDRNSIDSQLMADVEKLLEEAEQHPEIRAVVFTGTGTEYFIGGADGLEMMTFDPVKAQDFSARIQSFFNIMEQSELILAAAINGLCFGGGFEFAMACDMRIISRGSRIGLPEVKVGIIPGGGGTQRLPSLVGTGKAMEMILTGKLYTAQDAEKMGLVNLCVPADDLITETINFLDPVLKNPKHAISQAKLAVKAYQYGSLKQGLEAESQAFGKCFDHDFFTNLMNKQLDEGILKTSKGRPKKN